MPADAEALVGLHPGGLRGVHLVRHHRHDAAAADLRQQEEHQKLMKSLWILTGYLIRSFCEEKG